MKDYELNEFATDFNAIAVTARTPIIELNSVSPISQLRDVTQTSGTGTATNTASTYRLTHAASNDFASIRSAARGRYLPGESAQVGVGVIFDNSNIIGNYEAIWGYFDMEVDTSGTDQETINNGLVFGQDQDGFFVAVYKNGTVLEKTYQSNFLNAPDEIIDFDKARVFQIDYNYYGAGLIKFSIIKGDTGETGQRRVLLHTIKIDGETSLSNTNLQVGAYVKGASSSNFHLSVLGRQFSIIGEYKPVIRTTSEKKISATVGASAFVPLVTLRRKVDRRDVTLDQQGFSVLTDQNIIVQLRVGSTLTGASFGNLSDTLSTETALESDTSATAVDVATGVKIFEELAAGGAGNRSVIASTNQIPVDIPDEVTLTLCAKAISSSATVSAVLRVLEI